MSKKSRPEPGPSNADIDRLCTTWHGILQRREELTHKLHDSTRELDAIERDALSNDMRALVKRMKANGLSYRDTIEERRSRQQADLKEFDKVLEPYTSEQKTRPIWDALRSLDKHAKIAGTIGAAADAIEALLETDDGKKLVGQLKLNSKSKQSASERKKAFDRVHMDLWARNLDLYSTAIDAALMAYLWSGNAWPSGQNLPKLSDALRHVVCNNPPNDSTPRVRSFTPKAVSEAVIGRMFSLTAEGIRKKLRDSRRRDRSIGRYFEP